MASAANVSFERGLLLYRQGRHCDALASLEQTLAGGADGVRVHRLRAAVLIDLKRPAEAAASCDLVLAKRPDLPEAHANRAAARRRGALLQQGMALSAGRPLRGWLGLLRAAARRRAHHRELGGRLWDGTQDVRGKTVFTYAEQGLGDTLQFCRYATLLAQRGARVVLGVQATLTALLRDFGPGITVIGLSDPVPDYDYHCPLLSLPRAFRTRLDSIPAAIPYLVPDPARVVEWRRRLGAGDRLIGLRWQGSTRRVDIGRSFPLVCAGALAAVPGVRLISLQQGPGTEQLQSLPDSMRVEELGGNFEPDPANAFLDAAAVMCCLDLVITSDTSIAHLAGALGCPTWVALKHMPDWRWLLDREDSPWYPTLRLFRQREPGDWQDVFERMASELSVARAKGEPRSRPQA
jgi:hypothetical protein